MSGSGTYVSPRRGGAYGGHMASNPKRSVAWFGVAVAGGVLAAIGSTLSRPASGIVIILGVAVGIAGIVGARFNTDWYDFDKQRREGKR